MDYILFQFRVSLIERFCVVVFLIFWVCRPSEIRYSYLEALLFTALFGLLNWCYYAAGQNELYKYIPAIRDPMDEYWDKAFWVERYALGQLLLVCWFPIAGLSSSAIVGFSAFIAFVILPFLILPCYSTV